MDSIRIWIVNHFGKNPNRGGSPIKDKKFRLNINLVIGEFLIKNNWVIKNIFKLLNIITNMIVIKE